MATLCAEDYYVSNHTCVACAAGFENDAGDEASGSDTTCVESSSSSSDFPDYGIALVAVGVVGLIAVVTIVAIYAGACSGSSGSQVTQSGTGTVEMQGP